MAAGVRPTSGRTREALFSRWQEQVAGALFLDLFAGSGVVGLEAASRGASQVIAVEFADKSVAALEANWNELDPGGVKVIRSRLPRLPRPVAEAGPFPLVFADPPYDFGDYEGLLESIGHVLAPEGEAAVEHSSRTELPKSAGLLHLAEIRKYGESAVSFYRVAAG